MLDQFYITIFNHYKKTKGKQSLKIALLYINFLELVIVLILAAFFTAFASQMKITIISSTKFWVLYTLILVFIVFKNWLRYTGKKRNVLNAKHKKKTLSIYLLWLLPIGCLALAILFLQAF